MPKFRKKPVVVEAEQFFVGSVIYGVCLEICDTIMRGPHIHTLEGIHTVSEGDWIITGVKGEQCPCKPDIFKMTYEPVEESE